MHAAGERMVTRQYRNQKLLRQDEADYYDFEMSGGIVPVSTGLGFTIRKGDSFETECFYRTPVGHEATQIVWGLASSDEMCIDFIHYYPRQSLSSKTCQFHGALHGRYSGPMALESGDSAFAHTFGAACQLGNVIARGQSSAQIIAIVLSLTAGKNLLMFL
jgi:hypothetical protein